MTVRGIFYAPGGTLRAVWRVAGFVFLLFAALGLSGWLVRRLVPVRPQSFVAQQLFGFTIVLAAVAFAQFVMLRLVERRPWSAIGLGLAQFTRPALLAGLALGGLAILLPSLVLLGVHWLSPAAATMATGSSVVFALQIAGLILPQSLAEELISRGYGFAAIREGAGPLVAIVITSAIFGLLHRQNPGADTQSVTAVVLAGIFLGLIVVATGSVYAAWMAHFAWNFVIIALLHAKVSGIAFPSPGYTLIETGPTWATGGAWGPEGGAAGGAGMLAGMGALYLWRRRAARAPKLELANG